MFGRDSEAEATDGHACDVGRTGVRFGYPADRNDDVASEPMARGAGWEYANEDQLHAYGSDDDERDLR